MKADLKKLKSLLPHVTLYFAAGEGPNRGDWKDRAGLNLRAIDDHPIGAESKLSFSSIPSASAQVAIPSQIAIERFIHHLQKPQTLEIASPAGALSISRLEAVALVAL